MDAGLPRRRRRLTLVAVAIVALGIAAGGIAIAAIPDSDDVITACANRTNGQLRVIDAEAGATCNPRENQLTWSSVDRYASVTYESDSLENGPHDMMIPGADPQPGDIVDVAEVALGPGTYAVFGKTVLRGVPAADDDWGFTCVLYAGSSEIDATSQGSIASGSAAVNLQGVVEIASPTTARITCFAGADYGGGTWSASYSSIIALAIP